MIDFNKSTLFISARSPFARRVRLAFREHDIVYEEKTLDVFKPQPELIDINPLARVPALQLRSGNVLIDSNVILQVFYNTHKESSLILKSEKDLIKALKWTALSIGIYDFCISYYLEQMRPEEHRDQDLLREIQVNLERTYNDFEKFIAGRPTILNGSLSQADFDMGTAIAYTKLRYPAIFDSKKYPEAERYFKSLNDRPSFKDTQPPT